MAYFDKPVFSDEEDDSEDYDDNYDDFESL